MSERNLQGSLLADRRVRGVLGFAEAVSAAAIGVLYFEGVFTWLIVGIGFLNLFAITHVLGRVIESGSETEGVGSSR